MGSEMNGVWRCQDCGEMVEPMSPKWRMAGDRWQHHHDYPIGHVDATYFGASTITIPVAEYEGLKRRAFTVEELQYLASAVGQFDPTEYEEFTWDLFETVSAKLRAAIKEQEGRCRNAH